MAVVTDEELLARTVAISAEVHRVVAEARAQAELLDAALAEYRRANYEGRGEGGGR